jgi:hypothetical protein
MKPSEQPSRTRCPRHEPQHFIASLIEVGIGGGLLTVFFWFRTQMWERRAHRLAARSDIALPAHLVRPVARFLRAQYAFTVPSVWLTTALEVSVSGPGYRQTDWALILPPVVAGLPVALAACMAALAAGPRWKASGARRVTHPGSVPVRQAFTASELAAVVIGAMFAVAFGAWGLWRVGAVPAWWAASAATFGCAAAASWYVAKDVMNRPSSASDEIELGWDDLFRFQNARAVIINVAWVPTFVLLFLDFVASSQLSKSTTNEVWPIYAVIAAAVLLWLTFRQGRRLWRLAWLEPDRFR